MLQPEGRNRGIARRAGAGRKHATEPQGCAEMSLLGRAPIEFDGTRLPARFGFELMGALRLMQYRDLSAILIVVLLMVTLIDGLSGYLRRQFK